MRDDIFTTSSPQGLFVVLVYDPVTDETDAYGPMGEWDALLDAERRRTELDAEQLDDVRLALVPVQRPADEPAIDEAIARRGARSAREHFEGL